jgi:hypothetical protein
MTSGITCLITIHGIGFQQAPTATTPGYADRLHEHLAEFLDASLLSDDPNRARDQRGEAGPIYVQSSWPPESNHTEAGLSRLGTWVSGPTRAIDTSNAPLTDGVGRIAHVALVYSQLQDQGPHPGALLEMTSTALLSLGHYTSLSGLIHMSFADLQAMLEHPRQQGSEGSSLAVRTEMLHSAHHPLQSVDRLLHRPVQPARPETPTGLLTTLRTLEADVAAYVSRNDLRERVRSFVRDAIHRVCYRDDVSRVVVNAHSNGTVIGYDVLTQLTPTAAQKVEAFVTAGSPLRKYVELFYWGTQVGAMRAMVPPQLWTNFWDARDPVADPLSPPVSWRRGSALPPASDSESLFERVDPDSGVIAPVAIRDVLVDNVEHSSGGGLQAHNYWDNQTEVVAPLAETLRQLVAG